MSTVFNGLKFHLLSNGLGPTALQILKRAVVANGGLLSTAPRVDVDYLVGDESLSTLCSAGQLRGAFDSCSPKANFVSTRWIIDCISQSRILDSRPYEVFGLSKEKSSQVANRRSCQDEPVRAMLADAAPLSHQHRRSHQNGFAPPRLRFQCCSLRLCAATRRRSP